MIFAIVDFAIDLDGEFGAVAVEIEYVWADRMLAADGESFMAMAFQGGPEDGFGVSYGAAETAGNSDF